MKRYLAILLAVLTMLPQGFGYAQQDDERAVVSMKKSGAWLGIRIKEVKEIEDGKVTTGSEEGVYVSSVEKKSPAEKAGLQKGDVIVGFDGDAIASTKDLLASLGQAESGDKAAIDVLRDGKKVSLTATLGDAGRMAKKVVIKKRGGFPEAARHFALAESFRWNAKPRYGFVLSTLNPQLAEYFGAPDNEGVLIKEVMEESDAQAAGFKAGDVILHAGKKTVRRTEDFTDVLKAYDPGEEIPVRILRKGKDMTLSLTAKESRERPHGLMEQYSFDDDDEHGHPRVLRFRAPHAIDVDIDTDDLEEGLQRMEIRLKNKELDMEDLEDELEDMEQDLEITINGKKVELEDLQEHMEEMMQHFEDIDVDVDVEGDEDAERIIIRKRVEGKQPRKDT